MDDKLFWEKYFLTYDVLNEAIPYQKLMDDLIKALDVKNADLIFDAGSGTGNLCIRLKELGARPIGFDFSEKAIKIHLRKDRDGKVYYGNLINKLPFPDNYFDKVVSNNVMYTINKENRLGIIKEFHRMLKHNGKIVIANVHIRFNPFYIFLDTIKQSKQINGLLKTGLHFAGRGYSIAKLFYYSFLIIKNNKMGEFAFMEEGEQRNLLLQAGFRDVPDTISTYSNQSYLDSGVK